jgi:hypothetical protein
MSVSGAQWRKLACALPGAEEKSHFGHPDFRVRNKIFAGMSPDGKQGTLKLTPEFQAMLIDGKPEVFTPAAGAWGDKGWTHLVLAKMELGAAPELLREAWRLVAPKTLVAAEGGVQPAAAGAERAGAKTASGARAKKSGASAKKSAPSKRR